MRFLYKATLSMFINKVLINQNKNLKKKKQNKYNCNI